MPVEDLGHNTLLPTTMDKKMKHLYLVPSIKVVSFKVEDGFMSPTPSNLNIGSVTTSSTNEETVTEGTQYFGTGSIFRN